MGGGPASADVICASCILTFPETTMIEPVPVDAWYLHAVGLTFLRRLARDRVNEGMKIGLLMQQTDRVTQRKRYISVYSNDILRDALKETFEDPERVLVLHIVALDKVLGQRTIHVRPESNPNVSPEPVEPMSMVFPTLAVEDQHEVPVATPLVMSQSYDCGKSDQASCMHDSKHLSQSVLDVSKRRHEYQSDRDASLSKSQVTPIPEEDCAHSFAAAGAKLLSHSHEGEIPLARVVAQDEGDEVGIAEPSDFVMLDLQHGAGLEMMPATEASTFFISSNWHVHENDINSPLRFNTTSYRSPAQQQSPSAVNASSSSSSSNHSSSMEDSFVILNQDNISS